VIIFLYFLMMCDYVLTKYGMSIGFINEANILMLWLMNLSYPIGFLLKAILSAALVTPLIIAKKQNLRIYKIAMLMVFGAYIMVFVMHIYWIYWYMDNGKQRVLG
jgi:hypothetical protein